jgi:hypothetical protein
LDVVTIEDAADLAKRLLGVHRGQARLVNRDRDRHQPEFGCKLPPNAELPAGQAQVAMEDEDDEEGDWDNVLDPFGLALIMPAGIDTTDDDGGGVWARFRLFGDDDAGTIDNEEMEWTDEDEIDWEDDESDYVDAEDEN